MTAIQRIQERLEASGEEALGADGYDDCVVGLAYQHTRPLIVYSKRKVIERLMDDMSREDAEDFFDFNIGDDCRGDGFTKERGRANAQVHPGGHPSQAPLLRISALFLKSPPKSSP